MAEDVDKLLKVSQERLERLEFEERLREGEVLCDVGEDNEYLKEEESKAASGLNKELIPAINPEHVFEIPENLISTYSDGLGVTSRTEAEGAIDRLIVAHPLPPVGQEPMIEVSDIPQFAAA